MELTSMSSNSQIFQCLVNTPAIKEQAFAEVDIWHRRIQSKINVILKYTILALSRQMQASGDNRGITVERVYSEKMHRLLNCVLEDDKYGLSSETIRFILLRLQDYILLYTKKEIEDMFSKLPLLERLAGNGV
jgi:hypothetical protein